MCSSDIYYHLCISFFEHLFNLNFEPHIYNLQNKIYSQYMFLHLNPLGPGLIALAS